MNTGDSFEQKLQRQTPRQIPPSWRDDILANARLAASETTASAESHTSLLAAWRSRLTQLFWPHPVAWAGLAAAWILIVGLNIAVSDPVSPQLRAEATPPSPQLRELLRQQDQLFAELIGPIERSAIIEPRRQIPQPRSERRAQFLNA